MKSIFTALMTLVFSVTSLYGQCDKETVMKAINSVTPSDIENWCVRLTSEEFRGRKTGDIGYDLAAQWVGDYYKNLGVSPMGDNGSYLSIFDQPCTDVLDKGMLKGYYIIGKDTLTKEYAYMVDFFPTALSGNGEVTSDLVYVNYGISAPHLGFDSYKGVDVRGKIVLCDGGSPYKGSNLDTMMMWQAVMGHQKKVITAAQHGAAAILVINPVSVCSPSSGDKILAGYISPAAASDMLIGSGTTLAKLREANKSGKPKVVSSPNKVYIKASTLHHPDTKGSNVVAMIEGSDPKLKDEYIVIGAHLDHLGFMPEIYVGALDNASGSAIVMGVAKALKESGVELKRSVVFANFGAEEVGLVGTYHFLKTMPFDKEKVRLMVNFDMVGKGSTFSLDGSFHAKEQIETFVNQIDRWVHRPMEIKNSEAWKFNTYPRTDGGAFENLQIPVIYFGLKDGFKNIYYHHPLDKLDQLNYNIMCDVVRATAVSIIAEANR